MVSVKLILGLLAVLASAQCNPQPKVVDIALVVENLIEIVLNVVDAVDGGIKEADPSITAIVDVFPQTVGEKINQIRKDLLQLVSDTKARIDVIIKEIRDLIVAYDTISECTDKINADAEEILDKLSLALLDAVNAGKTNHADDIDKLVTEIKRIVSNFRNLFDESCARYVKASMAGSQTMKSDVQELTVYIRDNLKQYINDVVELVQVVPNTVVNVILDIVTIAAPAIVEAQTAAQPLLEKCGSCVADLSP